MSAKTARRRPAPEPTGDIPVVGGREPCPCGSGRRYKACHGRASGVAANPRPFSGRADECDLVALREIVPSATAPLVLADGSGRDVLLGTVLPLAWPAMVRLDGTRMLALQASGRSADLDRDLGQALEVVLTGEPGSGLDALGTPATGPGFVSLLDPAPLTITVHDGFDWWLAGVDAPDEEATAALEEANASVVPTVRLDGVSAAYWCAIGGKRHLRWALPDDEEPLLDALARLHAAGALAVGPGSRYVGAFRALGIVIPVWDLAPGTEAGAVEEPAAALRARLDEALAAGGPLTSDEKRARAEVVSRQLT
ncbi:MAG: DUF5926 family protein, partial [Mycobacteriales bacterium]